MSDAETGVQDGTDLYEFLDRPIANYVDGEWTQPSGGGAEATGDPAAGGAAGGNTASNDLAVGAGAGVAGKAGGHGRR